MYSSQGKYAEAEPLPLECQRSFEASRLRRAGALERSVASEGLNPYQALAIVSARLGKPAEAYRAAELNLGRGLLDEQAGRGGDALTAPEQRQRAKIAGRLATIEPRVLRLATLPKPGDQERKELDTLRAERCRLADELADELADLAAAVSRRSVVDLEQVHAVLAAHAALVTWVDVFSIDGTVNELWACVVRSTGTPARVRLDGSGKGGGWTREDVTLADQLRTAMVGTAAAEEVSQRAVRLHAQRLASLQQHLQGVKTLHVAAVYQMAGVPIEALGEKYTISYVPSGTFLARLKDRPKSSAAGLLALGDPVFGSGPRPKQELLVSRGAPLADLPGTRAEVGGIARLFGNQATVLLDSDASEQKLEELRQKGDLSKLRYLHFGTHGEANSAKAFESVLYLEQDKLPKGVLPEAGKPVINGELSAREVLEHWKLDAELVTLSACETALGKSGGGDGMLGFAQAFLAAGARSVCLSLWKVDDTATCLLMTRFYQNLLGKRAGLTKPMPKAEALREAKEWLRNLSADDAKKLTADLTTGVTRGDRGKGAKIDLVVPKDPKSDVPVKDDKPFAHPRYWAAFILIGDPS